MSEFKPGDIVRYGSGSTAIAEIISPHAGGWHARHVLGGVTFISARTFHPFHLADAEDLKVWKQKAWYRGERPRPPQKPRVRRDSNGVWSWSMPLVRGDDKHYYVLCKMRFDVDLFCRIENNLTPQP